MKEIKARNSVVERMVYVEGRKENVLNALLKALQITWSNVVGCDRKFDTVIFDNWMYGTVKVVIREISEEAAKAEVFWFKEDGAIRTHLEAKITPINGVDFDRHVSKSNFRLTTEIAILETLLESTQIENPPTQESERHPELDGRGNAARPAEGRIIKMPTTRYKSKKKSKKKSTDMRPYDRWTWCKPGYWRRSGYKDGTSYEYDAEAALNNLAVQ